MNAESFNIGEGGVTNPGSLKAKLNGLEQALKTLNEDLSGHKKDIQVLKAEKDTLQSVLAMKTADVRDSLTEELQTIENEMKRHFAHQKTENARLQQQITGLKAEKTGLQQQLIGLQRRITELELQIGAEEEN